MRRFGAGGTRLALFDAFPGVKAGNPGVGRIFKVSLLPAILAETPAPRVETIDT